jgi:hypothetical protein
MMRQTWPLASLIRVFGPLQAEVLLGGFGRRYGRGNGGWSGGSGSGGRRGRAAPQRNRVIARQALAGVREGAALLDGGIVGQCGAGDGEEKRQGEIFFHLDPEAVRRPRHMARHDYIGFRRPAIKAACH